MPFRGRIPDLDGIDVPPEALGSIDVLGHPICVGIYADYLTSLSQGIIRSPETTLVGFEPIRSTEGILLESSP